MDPQQLGQQTGPDWEHPQLVRYLLPLLDEAVQTLANWLAWELNVAKY